MAKKFRVTMTDFHKDPSWTDGPYKPGTTQNVYNYNDWSVVIANIISWVNDEVAAQVSDGKLEVTIEAYEEA